VLAEMLLDLPPEDDVMANGANILFDAGATNYSRTWHILVNRLEEREDERKRRLDPKSQRQCQTKLSGRPQLC
jgi:hypothetical protein